MTVTADALSHPPWRWADVSKSTPQPVKCACASWGFMLLGSPMLIAYGVVIGLATALCFALADPIARVLGKTGINVMTRLMGLILAALAVEVMALGLLKLFPGLGR